VVQTRQGKHCGEHAVACCAGTWCSRMHHAPSCCTSWWEGLDWQKHSAHRYAVAAAAEPQQGISCSCRIGQLAVCAPCLSSTHCIRTPMLHVTLPAALCITAGACTTVACPAAASSAAAHAAAAMLFKTIHLQMPCWRTRAHCP